MDWSPSVPTSAAPAPAGTIKTVCKLIGDKHGHTFYERNFQGTFNGPMEYGP